jgi:xanthine dehydrogenase YagR molybdenum-binding subunit
MKTGTDPVLRLDGPEKVTGKAKYSTDVRLPGQLYAKVLRSPHPHARIVAIDTSRAESMGGVHAVLSSANGPDIAWYEDSRLFDATVRFIGDEVAAVAAESDEIAEDALRLIRVDYLPLAFDVSDGKPADSLVQERGNVLTGLRHADVVVEETYTTQAVLHNALESHGCTAVWDGDELTLYESTQGIFDVRDEVAEKLGLAQEKVRVLTPHMGGGFGAKQVAWKHSVIAALLAKKAGRPVQLVLDRSEENLAAGNRNGTRQRVRIGAKRDGTLTAIDARITFQSGAYKVGGEDSDLTGTYMTLYKCDNVRAEQTAMKLNTGPSVAFRAPGYAEANFALESAMDELARKLGIDPVELRLRNYTGHDQNEDRPYTSPDSLRRCIERVSREFHPRRRGMGFAAHDWMAGGGWPPATVEVSFADGRAQLIVGVQDIGTGPRTALAQIAAAELEIPVEDVEVRIGDTRPGLRGPASSGSATLATVGPIVLEAARKAKKTGSARVDRGENRKDKSIRTCGAQCVEVQVDMDTGEVTVLRVVAAHDCGRIVNRLLVDSQVIGGVTQGLGYALSEERVIDERLGEPLNANLEEYKAPTVRDIPQIVNATESMPDDEANALGAKGIGEPPIIPTAAAIANAVFDATGVRIRDLPITRDKLLTAIKQGQTTFSDNESLRVLESRHA